MSSCCGLSPSEIRQAAAVGLRVSQLARLIGGLETELFVGGRQALGWPHSRD
jgi:hypothetical protein